MTLLVEPISHRLATFLCFCSLGMVHSFCDKYRKYFGTSDCLPVTETTAHTLAATIGLLGLYQDIQDEVLHQILEVVGPTRDPVGFLILFLHLTEWTLVLCQTFADYDALFKVLSAFKEAMRMFRELF
jgi:hypothetical protein